MFIQQGKTLPQAGFMHQQSELKYYKDKLFALDKLIGIHAVLESPISSVVVRLLTQ